jgi:ABC-type transporter Mla MlaB component
METKADEAKPGRLILDGELTIRTITSVHHRLRASLEASDSVELELGGAGPIDVSFVQLALAARRSAEAAGKRVVWAKPAAGPLRDVLIRGGFVSPVAGHASAAEAWWSTTAEASR